MKRLALLFSCTAALVCATDNLTNVHTVYLLKMAKGLDQYLASRLTEDHIFQVVADPKQADSIFTDQLGDGFEAKLEELFPTPVSAKPAPPPPKPEKTEQDANPMLGDTVNKLAPLTSSFGRAKGTVFLVDAKSRRVIWSVFEPPKSGAAKDMDRTANDIVSRLKKDLKGK